MAGSRLEKLGTIFSRVSVLLRSGVLSRYDKPIWYDVYQVFPPKTEPSYAVRRPYLEIREILYPEDSIRAKIHRKIYQRLPMESLLQETTNDITRSAISATSELMLKDPTLSEDQAIDKIIGIYQKEGLFRFERKQDTSEKEHDHHRDYRNEKKTISDKNIDVSQFLKE